MHPISSPRFTSIVFVLVVGMLIAPMIATAATLSNAHLTVEIDDSSGALTVTDRASDRRWGPDPWNGAAGLFEAARAGSTRWHNLSDAASVQVTKTDPRTARIVFDNLKATVEQSAGWKVTTEIALAPDAAEMTVRVVAAELPPGAAARRLYYPLRPFALRTDVDRRAAVLPY